MLLEKVNGIQWEAFRGVPLKGIMGSWSLMTFWSSCLVQGEQLCSQIIYAVSESQGTMAWTSQSPDPKRPFFLCELAIQGTHYSNIKLTDSENVIFKDWWFWTIMSPTPYQPYWSKQHFLEHHRVLPWFHLISTTLLCTQELLGEISEKRISSIGRDELF